MSHRRTRVLASPRSVASAFPTLAGRGDAAYPVPARPLEHRSSASLAKLTLPASLPDQALQADLLSLQHRAGNRAVSELVKESLTIQRAEPPVVQRQVPLAAGRRAKYEKALKYVVPRLGHIRFGRAEERRQGQPGFDRRYWEVRPIPGTRREKMLVLKQNRKPSDAIGAIVDEPEKWSVDCAQWVQVAELYALLVAMGASKFDRLRTHADFALRVQHSTGVQGAVLWGRERPGQPFIKTTADGRQVQSELSVDAVVDAAPVGARVAWTLDLIPSSSPWHQENAVIVGLDRFAAHGFGSKHQFSRAELERALVANTQEYLRSSSRSYLSMPGLDDIKRSVFISRIEIYKLWPK